MNTISAIKKKERKKWGWGLKSPFQFTPSNGTNYPHKTYLIHTTAV
jgi:hypothetical protein